jgi:hypothetical protein
MMLALEQGKALLGRKAGEDQFPDEFRLGVS